MPSSSDAVATTTRRSPSFRRRSARWRRSRDRLPWWAATRVGAQPLAQVQRHPLDQPPRVDEHQRRLVLARQRRDPIVELAPLLVGAHRAELVLGDLDRQIEIAPLADVDDLGQRRGRPTSRRAATSSGRTVADSPTRCSFAGRHQRLQPLERQRQVRAALVGRDGVDLVDDHRPHVAQRPPPRLRRQQDEQRLGRRDQDVRRLLGRLRAARAPSCRRSGPRSGRPAPGSRAPSPAPAARRAAPRGSGGCRSTAPSAATRRGRWCGRAARRPPRSPRRPGGPAPTGTRPASCPIPSAPCTGRPCPRRSAARPAPAPASARRTGARARWRRPGETFVQYLTHEPQAGSPFLLTPDLRCLRLRPGKRRKFSTSLRTTTRKGNQLMGKIIGIDLGTTNSVVGDHGGQGPEGHRERGGRAPDPVGGGLGRQGRGAGRPDRPPPGDHQPREHRLLGQAVHGPPLRRGERRGQARALQGRPRVERRGRRSRFAARR